MPRDVSGVKLGRLAALNPGGLETGGKTTSPRVAGALCEVSLKPRRYPLGVQGGLSCGVVLSKNSVFGVLLDESGLSQCRLPGACGVKNGATKNAFLASAVSVFGTPCEVSEIESRWLGWCAVGKDCALLNGIAPDRSSAGTRRPAQPNDVASSRLCGPK